MDTTKLRPGDVIVVANSTRDDHGRSDRGDYVGIYPSEEEAYEAVRRGVGGYARGVLAVEVVGRDRMRIPRGTELESA